MGSASNPPDAHEGNDTRTVEEAHATLDQVAADVVTSIAQATLGGTRTQELENLAEELLPSIAPEGAHGEKHDVPPPLDSHVPIIDNPGTSHMSSSSPSPATEEEVVQVIESPTGNSLTLVGDVAKAAANTTMEDVKDKAQALLLARLHSTFFVFLSKLPIVGSYVKDPKHTGETGADASATETTPLLGALRDPKAFVTEQAEGFLLRMVSPLLQRLPDINNLDNVESSNYGLLFKIFVECCFLARDGGGWFFAHLQEHSLVIAPTVSLGHLSTEDLAASTIGTAVASVTGYSIIQGFTSSLDKVLAKAPNHHVSKIACAQATVVTGVVLFPITQLWTVHSGSILQQLGQSPEVAVPASKFLQIAAAGLPGYAIGEIAKRYLTSQGLSHVHTRLLSVTAPLNLILNYLLVDGPIPALRLGFSGAPLCTVLSHNALAIMLIVYIVLRAMREEIDYLRGQNVIPDEPVVNDNSGPLTRGNRTEQPQDHSSISFFTGLGTLVFAGVGGVLKSASQLWSKDFGGGDGCKLGPHILATQAVLLTTATTLYQAPRATSNVTSDRIKKWTANGDTQRAKIASSVGFVGTLGGVIVIGYVLLQSATSWGRLFNSDPVVLQNVSMLLPIIAIFQVVNGLGAWTDSSLGALGKSAVFPSFSASADYFLGIPLGVYLAFQRQWGLAGLWVGLSVSLACSCLLSMLVLVRTNWKGAAVKKRENVEQGRDQLTREHREGGVPV